MQARPIPAAFALALALCAAQAATAQKDDTWIEIRSPHFTVISNSSERAARRTAEKFEQFRAVFQYAFPKARVDSGVPLVVLLAKNEKSLKALLPAYWETKGRAHPAGVYIAGEERSYAALHLDSASEDPFHVIYHEYSHELNKLNISVLPVWLDEGLAELFGYAELGDKESSLGRFSEGQLYLLKTQRLLPLPALLSADHQSPYYNEANRASMFYAQSWALAHWLLLGDRTANYPKLTAYLQELDKGATPVDAATHAFGDLKELQKLMEQYARQDRFFIIRVSAPAEIDESKFAMRTLPPAEALAVQGDFYVRTGRQAEALTALEAALKAEPLNARANESMGFLYLRLEDAERAAKYFSQAMKADSQSFLAHYHFAGLGMRNKEQAPLEEIEAHLRRAIELNPGFARAYSTLAAQLASRNLKLEEALALATKAAQLEPGAFYHKVNVMFVLLRLERADDALNLGNRLLQIASTDEERAMVVPMLNSARQLQLHLTERKAYEQQAAQQQRERQESLREFEAERKRAEEEKRAAESSGSAPKPSGGMARRPGSKAAPSSANPARNSLAGRIAGVACEGTQALILSLEIAGKTYRFRTSDYRSIDYLSTGWTPPANFQPCKDLPQGADARVQFTPTPGAGYFGVLLAVEIRE